MQSEAKKELTSNEMDWFDLSEVGIYITPELICGRPCILLLDSSLLFNDHPLLKGKLKDHGFEIIEFEFNSRLEPHLYILFTETLDSNLFYKDLRIPKNTIKKFQAPLLAIQNIFYEHTKTLYGFRVDVLIKSSQLLGVNHQKNKVYSSMFGRYKISSTGYDSNELIYTSEPPHERSLSFLRANSAEDVLFCCEGYIKDAISNRRNVSLNDAIKFAKVLFEDRGSSRDLPPKPYQILTILNVFGVLYIKNILPINKDEIKNKDFFNIKEHFKSVCLNSEACPSPPRGIYTDYLASQYNTPAPLSFIMQKLLIQDEVFESDNNFVLDPMFGYGSLTNLLSIKNYPIIGYEKNSRKVQLVKALKQENLKLESIDSVNSNLLDFKNDKNPFRYVICNPACIKNSKKYEYSDTHGSIVLDRTDHIMLLKSLVVRADAGRCVFLLPHFMDSDSKFSQNQDFELESLLNFVQARYNIEGAITISSEIYSKSLRRISPILLIVGDKKSKFDTARKLKLKDVLSNVIRDYESLWDWCNLICYKRSDKSQFDQKLFEETLKNIDLSPIVAIEPQDNLLDWNSNTNNVSEDKSTKSNLTLSDNLFSFVEAAPQQKQVDSPLLPPTDNLETQEANGQSMDTELVESIDSTVIKDETNKDLTSNEENTISLNKDEEISKEAVSLEKEVTTRKLIIKKKEQSTDKITKNSGNLFDLAEKNKIIRYHSVATLSEPTSNIHQNEFSAYLLAKHKLNEKIVASFDQITPLHPEYIDTLVKYIEQYKVDISAEAFIGAHLKIGSPKDFAQYFKSEHIDLICAGILNFLENSSMLTIDSLGIENEVAMAALMHFARVNEKGVIYLAKDEIEAKKLLKTFDYLNENIFKSSDLNITLYDKDFTLIKSNEDFSKNDLLVIINDLQVLSKLKGKLEIPNAHKFYLFADIEMDAKKYSAKFITDILAAPTFFRANKFISSDTNLNIVKSLFSKNVFDRYFANPLGEMDDMGCHLLKTNLIQELKVFERFEDLSHIKIIENEATNAWLGKYEILAQSYSTTINNIVLLAEDIQKNIPQRNNQLHFIRNIAMEIFELCTFCISSVPLTYSIFNSIKNHTKPVVVIPKSIENTLFNLLDDLNIAIDENELNIKNIKDLNILIDSKLREIDYENHQSSHKHLNLINELKILLNLRSQSILNYFTLLKVGKDSKYPDITGLISIFYKYCTKGLNKNLDNYDELIKSAKQIELEIGSLLDLPLCIIDFIKYELDKYQIRCCEISSRTTQINYDFDTNSWLVSKNPPYLAKYNEFFNKEDIANEFNTGEYDVIFIESNEINDIDLSAIKSESAYVSDHMRKRCLFLTYFNQDIDHYLNLIHRVNNANQVIAPEIYFEVPESPVQQAFATLIKQQLGLYNISYKNQNLDLSYYLNNDGKKLILEYLSLNPRYQAHYPNLPAKNWNIYHILNIANMVDSNLQNSIIEHLSYFSKQNLEYLRDIKSNPFDIFMISPKAQFNKLNVDSEIGYLNKPLNDSDGVFNKSIEIASLSYVKNMQNCFTLDECKDLHKTYKDLEVTRLKSLLETQFGDLSFKDEKTVKHSDCLNKYISHFNTYLISVFRDKIANKLNDRYRNWIYHNNHKRISNINYLKNHFIGNYGLRVSNNLDDLYLEVLMLADIELIQLYEDSCKVLTFLKAYLQTVLRQENGDYSSPILLPIPSPFNDKSQVISEGLLLKVNYPTSLMVSLSPKSFTLTMAYPSKSKPTDINLSYALKHPAVLKGESILCPINDRCLKIILKAYNNTKFRDLLAKKISDQAFNKITEFSDLEKIKDVKHHKTIMGFNITQQTQKIRNMDVLYGNLFDTYCLLKNQISLTMVSFINPKGITQYGFVIPADMEISYVLENLIRVTNLNNISNVYKLLLNQPHGFKYLRSITWLGKAGRLEVGHLNSNSVSLNFIGTEKQLQNILLDQDIFKEYPVTNEVDDNGNYVITDSKKTKKETFSFQPLDLLDADIHQRGEVITYSFRITHKSFDDLIHVIKSKKSYDVALLDCHQKSERNTIKKAVN